MYYVLLYIVEQCSSEGLQSTILYRRLLLLLEGVAQESRYQSYNGTGIFKPHGKWGIQYNILYTHARGQNVTIPAVIYSINDPDN